jgi:hypothetical protein
MVLLPIFKSLQPHLTLTITEITPKTSIQVNNQCGLLAIGVGGINYYVQCSSCVMFLHRQAEDNPDR